MNPQGLSHRVRVIFWFKKQNMPEYTPERYHLEEKANALTHLPGILLALVATPYLLYVGKQNNASDWQLLGIGLFGFSIFVLYFASTLYHSVHDLKKKKRLRIFDHIAIYFLIAGSHTPFVIRYLDNTKGYVYLAVLWSLLLLGTFGKIFMLEKWERLSLVLYIFMGWMVVFVFPDMLKTMESDVLTWIAIGGLSYTFGVLFFIRKKMFYSHAIWHLFVLAGTAGHAVALWLALLDLG